MVRVRSVVEKKNAPVTISQRSVSGCSVPKRLAMDWPSPIRVS